MTTNVDQQLDATFVWDQAGHLTEAALHALADGELGLLPAQAVAHSAGCRQCEERLGTIALLAVEIGDALVKHRRELVPVRRPLPVAAFVAALAIAVAGAVTQLGGMAAQLARLPMLIAHASPVLARGLALAVGGSGGASFVAAGWVATALLVLVGVLIARRAPLRMGWKGSA